MRLWGLLPLVFLSASASLESTTDVVSNEVGQDAGATHKVAPVRRQSVNGTNSAGLGFNSSIVNPACPGSRWPPLVVMTYNAPPFVFINETNDGGPTQFSGISIDVLAELAQTVGFCYNITYEPGVRASGVIAEVLNTTTQVNFGIGTITITAERYTRNIYFSMPHYALSLQILVRKPVQESTWFAFLEVFSWDLWGMIVLAGLVFAISIFLFERNSNESQFMYDSLPKNCALSGYYTTEYMFTAGTMRPETGAGRTLLIGLLILTLAISAGYTAQLTSILTQQALETPLQDVDRNGVIDETDLMSQSDRVCIAENTAIEQFYNSEISNQYIRGRSGIDCGDAVRNGTALATVFDAPLIQYYALLHPTLEVIGRPMNKQGYGVAVSPLFPDLADAISIQLTIMQQNGMLVRIKARWLPEVPPAQDSEVAQLTPKEFIGLYIFMAIFYAMAWLVFLLQEYRLGWPSFDKKNWKRLKYSETSREDREKILAELNEHGKLPTISLYERLLLQILLELTLNEKAETRQEVADRLQAEENGRELRHNNTSISSVGSSKLSNMLSRLQTLTGDVESGSAHNGNSGPRAESPDSGAPMDCHDLPAKD